MFNPSENLFNIVVSGADNNCVVEFYADDAVPPFDASEALLRYTNIHELTAFGETYEPRVLSFGQAKRIADKEKNTFSVTLDNLDREAADFELSGGGFEGKIMVVRLVSRSRSSVLTDSLIFWAGKCLKPKGGSKMSITVEAEQVFGSIEQSVPRRKFTPNDSEGRAASDKNFEGFVYLPQHGVLTYKRRKSWLWGAIKRWKDARLFYSSFSDIDTDKDLPECVGRVQIVGTHLAYWDAGAFIRTVTAFMEGPIKEYLRIYSTEFRFAQYGALHKRFGYGPDVYPPAPNAGFQQIPIPEAGWFGNGYYANTAWVGTAWSGTAIDETDPAPDVAVLVLAKIMKILDSSDEFTVDDWTDNGAAVVRHFLLNEKYGKLNGDWLNDESFVRAYQYNGEYLFDQSFSDLIFAPTGTLAENVEASQLLLPTSSVTTEYLKYLAGDADGAETFNKNVTPVEYADGLIPIEPEPNPTPGPGTPTAINLNVFLRRRWTTNAVANKRQKLWDWLNEVILSNSRMFLTQGFDGKVHLKHKKPADFALGTSAIDIADAAIDVDDVSRWIETLRGSVLIQPHSPISEVRRVTDANYSSAQNSVTLTASANIAVTGFAGCDGDQTPATALLAVDSVLTGSATPNAVTLDGVEIAVIASSADTVATVAGFFFATINAHPRLRRKFRAEWTAGADEVTITAKFGTLELDNALEYAHPAALVNPAAPLILTAEAGGSLAAGTYRVAYAYENANGRSMISPVQTIVIAAGEKISVTGQDLLPGVDSIIYYVSPEPNSYKLRYLYADPGTGFYINSLPPLTAGLPNDFNRTGTEILRVEYCFSDRANTRANIESSNVLKDTYKFLQGENRNGKNLVKIEFRDATQDFRSVELTVRDEAHIEKIGKENKLEVDGSSVDNFHQAYRLAAGMLAEKLDADFFYENESDREALFLEEADVVCVTDSGAGLVNFPVIIEEMTYSDLAEGLPKASFRMRKYSSTLYDDSVVEREIPVFQSLADTQPAFEAEAVFGGNMVEPVFIDRVTGVPYRAFVSGGVWGIEPATGDPPTVPDEFVLDGIANPITSSTVSFFWSESFDRYGVAEYQIQRATDAGFTTGLATQNFAFPAEAGTVTGLAPNTDYWFRLRVKNVAGVYSAYHATVWDATTLP